MCDNEFLKGIALRNSEKFENHPGYAQIMAQLPDMYLAVCGHRDLTAKIDPFSTALGSLVFLYEELEQWENIFRTINPDGPWTIIADRNFPYACKLFISCLNRLALTETKNNAKYVAGLLEVYRTSLEKIMGCSVTYAKSSPLW